MCGIGWVPGRDQKIEMEPGDWWLVLELSPSGLCFDKSRAVWDVKLGVEDPRKECIEGNFK